MKREIFFYRTINDKCPVKDFLDSQPGKIANKITWVLGLIESLKIIPQEYFKKIAKEIWEVRIQFGNNIYRILGFFDGNRIIVLNHAFTKKTQKTPRKEIEIAEERRKDYLRRK